MPQGALSERRKGGLVQDATQTVLSAAGLAPDDALRVWVLVYEQPDGTWGAGGWAAPSSGTPTWSRWRGRERSRPMRELTYVARRTVEWRETPDLTVQSAGEAIVTPVAATSCDVDSAILAGHRFIDPPFALGHECVARVADVGDNVTTVAPGDLVVVPWSISCGTCDHCRAGLTAHCTSVPHMTMYGAPIGGAWGGLFSDLVRVPYADAKLVSLPTGLDPVAMASASDNWSLSWRLVAPHLTARPGARVLVVARGSIGLYVCDIARGLGASDVLYVDPDPEHRKLAESFGARTAEAIPLRVSARVTGTDDRKIFVEGPIATEAVPSTILVQADGIFVAPDPEAARALFPALDISE